MSLSGSLQVTEVSQLVHWARQGSRTGALHFEKGDVRKKLYFDAGRVVGSASTVPQEWLGHFLVGRGLITEIELAKAIELQEESGMLLGSILVTIGGISQPQLAELLVQHCTEILCDLLTWTDGTFEFHEGEIPRGLVPADIDIGKALLEGVKRMEEWRRIRQTIPSLDLVPIALGELEPYADDAVATQVLSRVDDDRSIQEILLDSHSTEYAGCLTLTRAIEAGAIKLIAPRAPREVVDPSKPARATPAPTAKAPEPDPKPRHRITADELLACSLDVGRAGEIELARRYLEAARCLAGSDERVLRKVARLDQALPRLPGDVRPRGPESPSEHREAPAAVTPAAPADAPVGARAHPPRRAVPPNRAGATGAQGSTAQASGTGEKGTEPGLGTAGAAEHAAPRPAYRSIPRTAPARRPRPSAKATDAGRSRSAPVPAVDELPELDRSHIPTMSCPPEEITQLDLTPEQGFLLSRMDGRMTLGELIKISPIPADQAERALGKLVAAGHVALRPRS